MTLKRRLNAALDAAFEREFGPRLMPETNLTPDPLSADEAEHGLCAPPELTAEQMAEGDLTEIRR